jgi:Glycosyl hydrolases family 35/Beta-galactosidase jelly roll domain
MAELEITYDRASLFINGRREFIRSGAMHYFRLPSQALWRDRLFKLKAAGYNTVDLYFSWAFHSSAPGEYDFSGIRDIAALLEITRELGLYVIARPGPYINAETSGGGFPGWLLARRDLPLRHRRVEDGVFEWSDEYMAYVTEWWRQIVPLINASDNVILVQIENEYATQDMEPEYMQALYNLTRELGVKVPLFHNDLYVAGLYEDLIDIYAFDNYSVTQFETDWRHMPEVFQVLDNIEANLRPFCQNRPLMAAELQAGWYGGWKGYKYEKITELLGRDHISISTKSLLGQGLTIFNHYKAIGGTNWGYLGSVESYTSYDFGAPISEAGLNTERLFESKAINQMLSAFDWTNTERREEFPAALSRTECVYAIRGPVETPESAWLFLRNLNDEPHSLTVDARYSVQLKPFEAQILPWRIPLQCGYELLFSSSELVHQTESLLVVKANRAVMLGLSAKGGPLALHILGDQTGNQPNDISLLKSETERTILYCPELDRQAFRHIQIGQLNVLFLGPALVDTFWLEEDGHQVFGPEMRLPMGYALSGNTRRWWRLAPDGASITTHSIPETVAEKQTSLQPRFLTEWEICDNAPELWPDSSTLKDFQPVSQNGADFDANALYEGNAWYRLSLHDSQAPTQLEIDARHLWAVFLNGVLIDQGQNLVLINGMESPAPHCISILLTLWKADGPNELLIFVDGLGHPKGFHDDAQTPQGLLLLNVDGEDCTTQVTMARQVYTQRHPGQIRMEAFTRSPIVSMKTSFSLPTDPHIVTPWGLRLENIDCERIDIILNGILIGRYWRQCQRQALFYLPPGILKTEPNQENTLELILMNPDPFLDQVKLKRLPCPATLHPYEVFICTD